MEYLQNLHTHTTFCDGKSTAEEIVLKAIELGFDTIGFSGHSPVDTPIVYYVTEEKIPEYKAEIARLKSIYNDRIKVLCGIEYDMFSTTSQLGYDYIIGSNHHIFVDGKLIDIDQDAETTVSIINKYFDGDFLKYAEKFYETSCQIPYKVNADFIAHIDILTKNSERSSLINPNTKEYEKLALETIHTISKKLNVFEVNTGVISRGYRTTPYPSPVILKEINAIGGHVIITSDCHNMEFLNFKYDLAIEIIKSCGFKEIYVMTDNGFKGISLK